MNPIKILELSLLYNVSLEADVKTWREISVSVVIFDIWDLDPEKFHV